MGNDIAIFLYSKYSCSGELLLKKGFEETM